VNHVVKWFFMKIAIVKLSALGDIVHAMVVLQFIKKFNKEISIDWFVEESYKDLLEFHPDINNIYLVNLRQAKKKKSLRILIREFKKLRKLTPYDVVIDMQGLIKSAIISRIIASNSTIGFDKHSSRESFASIFYNKKFNINYGENVIERNLELIKFALDAHLNKMEIYNKKPFLFPKNKFYSSLLSHTEKNIILVPGASHSSKRYPLIKFVDLTIAMNANYIVVWGNKEEKIIAEKIKALSKKTHVSEKLSISSLISLISQADLIIGPDTGPTHIGWAMNVPSISLFGPTPGYRNSYITNINKIIESESKVDPFNIDQSDNSIQDIDINKIIKISRGLLNR
jgi:heptosyltransferase I